MVLNWIVYIHFIERSEAFLFWVWGWNLVVCRFVSPRHSAKTDGLIWNIFFVRKSSTSAPAGIFFYFIDLKKISLRIRPSYKKSSKSVDPFSNHCVVKMGKIPLCLRAAFLENGWTDLENLFLFERAAHVVVSCAFRFLKKNPKKFF